MRCRIHAVGWSGRFDDIYGRSGLVTEKSNDGVRAVDRALDILMAFTATDYELTAAQLLKRVDLSRPTLYRLLYTLEQSGFLVSEGDPQRFRLGSSVAHLAHVWTSSLDISSIAQPMLRRIWEISGETVALFVPQGADRVCVAEIPSLQPLSFKRGIGYKESLALGASGRVILAFTDYDVEQIRTLIQGMKISLDDYEKELEATRQRGYGISRHELIAGAVAVAAPFFNGSGNATGSIGVFGPSVRMNEEKIEQMGQLLRQESENLSAALGLRRK
jgi:IclR family acetate operon transcriptional repressor